MPTEASQGHAALFLFAHQDDEFGVYQRILHCRQRGLRVACAYLTDGQTATASADQRNRESLTVLARLGVDPQDVYFAGAELGIGDACLAQHLPAAAGWIGRWLDRYPLVDALHVTAWEGGHHDHDALHALALLLAAERGLLARTLQFSLYQAKGLPGPLFRVLAPLSENGPAVATRIPWRARRQHLRACLSYPSQRATWLGLFPFVLAHYLLRGVEQLQPVALHRLDQRPHAGALYYEKRKFFTWPQMQAALAAWRATISSN
ncbi:PIG-L family deacetylase [Massilia yuzhufengensis]|uniref:GlcNAc-PI de-N-acetylase n=1 Tax=Massilia yuzhufengensis TaxID=1164594 RepID=A0A1I1VS30_9BURK|nr:PIG-L family deacetylase [Massilia yuzhufengensis]SFD85655.1 GlcNAc-PI de-N-acetylase [Massilia yuzhufengensis]